MAAHVERSGKVEMQIERDGTEFGRSALFLTEPAALPETTENAACEQPAWEGWYECYGPNHSRSSWLGRIVGWK